MMSRDRLGFDCAILCSTRPPFLPMLCHGMERYFEEVTRALQIVREVDFRRVFHLPTLNGALHEAEVHPLMILRFPVDWWLRTRMWCGDRAFYFMERRSRCYYSDYPVFPG
ncbi:hypothetical protein LIER_23095 [Lithospermum erythrorhizon]|uniref:Uncharacterized protein n=1 Tax=Lithospermum erythrorhizon TaxID=34254 RepID=A0AAV3R0F5_LITER